MSVTKFKLSYYLRFHVACIFDVFSRARASTKVVEEAEDIDGFPDLKQEDRKLIMEKIDELQVTRMRRRVFFFTICFDRRLVTLSLNFQEITEAKKAKANPKRAAAQKTPSPKTSPKKAAKVVSAIVRCLHCLMSHSATFLARMLKSNLSLLSHFRR